MAGGIVGVPNCPVGDSLRTVLYWSSTGTISPAATYAPVSVPDTPAGVLPAACFSGQVPVSDGVLPSHVLTKGNVVLRAPLSNTSVVYVGPPGVTTATGQPLEPGSPTSVVISNTAGIGIAGSVSTDTVGYLAS